MKLKAQILDEAGLNRSLMRIAHEVLEHNKGAENLRLVGVRRRGGPIARRIAENILRIEGQEILVGSIDISFYRDDQRISLSPEVHRTEIPFNVESYDIVLVDDVLFTGRTIRAALDALMDYGRPRRIELAVLVDRGHRELPIRADFVGKNVPSSLNEQVRCFLEPIDDESAVRILAKGEGERAGSAPLPKKGDDA